MSVLRTMLVDESHSPSSRMAEGWNQSHQQVSRTCFPKARWFVLRCPVCGCRLELGNDPEKPCSPSEGWTVTLPPSGT